jgi:amidase
MARGTASRAASLPELCFTGARALARMLRARKVSASELMQAFIAQIERVNPRINAIVTFVPSRR